MKITRPSIRGQVLYVAGMLRIIFLGESTASGRVEYSLRRTMLAPVLHR